MSLLNFDIEKADNGFVTKQDRGTGYKNAHKVFVSFEDLIEEAAFFFGVIKIGESYRSKVFKEELEKQQSGAR